MILFEPDLLGRLRLGDRDAYIQVAEQYHKEVWAYIYRLCGDRELASDLCQETALAVWRAAPDFRGIESLRAWIYRVAHNVFVDHCRRNRLTSVSLEQVTDANCQREPDIADAVIQKSVIDQALMRLSENTRAAVILTKVQGFSCQEAADVLGVPVGTVKWWVAEGLKVLRRAMLEDEKCL